MSFQMPPYGRYRGERRPPNAKQAAFHASTAPFKGFVGGVGSGKTHCIVRDTVMSALENGPNQMYLIGAPSHPILETATWEHFCRFLNDFALVNGVRLDTKRRISPQNRSIVLQGGIVLRFICLKNPQAFAGPTISGFAIDEAALLENGMAGWNMLMDRLRDSRAKRLFGYFATSPRGPVGIVEHFRQQVEARNPEYFLTFSRTADNTANLPPGWIRQRMAGRTPREIAQQFDAQILDFDGAVYAGAFDNARSLATGWNTQRDIRGREIYVAIDWGPTYPHVLWIAHDPKEDFDVVFGELCEDRIDHRLLLDRLLAHQKKRWGLDRDGITALVTDANPEIAVRIARRFFADANPKLRIPVKTQTVGGTSDLLDGIDTVSGRLQDHIGQRRLLFAPELDATPSERRILQCMRLYQWQERQRAGLAFLDDDIRPLKNGYDHGADALRYYCWWRYRWQRLPSLQVAA